jgi:glycosyltransferase involved in cell wall biosynthesis
MTKKEWKAKSGWTMIVKNEEKVLGRCLKSMRGCWDEGCLVIVDTGSTDRTVEIAKEYGAIVENFTWIKDFGAARQFALNKLYEHCPDIDWWGWCDADDILMSPDDITRYRELLDEYLPKPEVQGINFGYIYTHEKNEVGNQGIANFKYHRLRCCKKGYGKWTARIHEYIAADRTKQIALKDIIFHHFRDEELGTLNTKRNLDILRLVVNECSPEERTRTLFYYAKECTYNKLWDEAIKAFEEYLPVSNWVPEKHRAMYELAVAYRNKKEFDKAREYAFKAINLDRRYPDPWLYLTQDAYEDKDYKMAIAYAMMIPKLENTETLFFDYIPAKTYYPWDYAQASYAYLNDYPKAKQCLLMCMMYRPHDRRYLNNYVLYSPNIERIGIVIPTLNRKERLLNCLKFIRENAFIKNYAIYIGVDGNEKYFNELNEELKDQKDITTVLYEKKSTVPIIVEDLIDIAEADGCKYVSYLSDDTEPLVGFLIHAYEACQGKNLVVYNDKVFKGEIANRWFAPVELRKQLGGYFFYKGYNHVGRDNELAIKAKAKGLYKFCENAFVDHVHYNKNICSEKNKVAEYDECYKLIWENEDNIKKDRELLRIRTNNNFLADKEEVRVRISSTNLEYAGVNNIPSISSDILEESLFNNETIDQFLCQHVLQTFSYTDAERIMKILYNALKKGGELEIAVPDVGRIDEIKDEDYKLKILYGRENAPHLSGYNQKSLRELFEVVGFTNISCESDWNFKSDWNFGAPEIIMIGKK